MSKATQKLTSDYTYAEFTATPRFMESQRVTAPTDSSALAFLDVDTSITLESPLSPVVVLDTFRSVPWLREVRRRIASSVDDRVNIEANDGSTINSAVARYAVGFFDVLGWTLPCEPYLYATLAGALACEFHTEERLITVIIHGEYFVASNTNQNEFFAAELTSDPQQQRNLRRTFGSYISA